MRSTSKGSKLNPESANFVPGVRQEARAPIRNAYDDRDLQGTNSHAHPENTQLSEPMASMSNLASGHGYQTPSAASSAGREYVGYIVRQSPTSSATSRTRKAETSGGYELAEAEDSISAAAAGTLPNSEIDNNSQESAPTKATTPRSYADVVRGLQKGKSKETTPPMSSNQNSDIHRKSQEGKSKCKDKATEITHPMSHPGVDVRENSQEDRPSGATATTSNLETIAESDRDSIRTRKPSDVPGEEIEDEDEANGGSVGRIGEGADDGDPSSSTRPTKKRRRKKKKSSQPTEKIEETVNEEAANEERSAKEEKAREEGMHSRMNICKSILSKGEHWIYGIST